jgi:hypothetical protein
MGYSSDFAATEDEPFAALSVIADWANTPAGWICIGTSAGTRVVINRVANGGRGDAAYQ